MPYKKRIKDPPKHPLLTLFRDYPLPSGRPPKTPALVDVPTDGMPDLFPHLSSSLPLGKRKLKACLFFYADRLP